MRGRRDKQVIKSIPVHGQMISYEEWGDSSSEQVVLCLHGWGAHKELFAQVASPLAHRVPCRVVAPDFPGFGQSEIPSEAWGVDDFVEFVVGFLEELHIFSVNLVVGHSHGGRVALKVAVKYPALVKKLLLVGSAGIKSPPTLEKNLRIKLFKCSRFCLEHLLPKGKLQENALNALRGYFGSADYRDAGVMRDTLVRVLQDDLTSILPQVSQSTLLVWGENDTDSPLRNGKLMEELIPDAGLVVWKGAGHYAFLDRPEEFVQVAEHFLTH